MKPKPVVGQTLYRLNIGNAARDHKQELIPVEVKKVGKKYFKCGNKGDSEWEWDEYYLENWHERSDYSSRSCLFSTEQEYFDMKERTEFHGKLREIFSFRNTSLNLSQLRRIMAIIEEG